MTRSSSHRRYLQLAATTPLLLALTALAESSAPAAPSAEAQAPLMAQAPASSSKSSSSLQLDKLMQAEPSGAGPLSRAAVIRELQRARSAGELNWADFETTGHMR